MQIFNYDQQGVFIHASDARESPREPGVFLIPANATTHEPPTTQTDEVAVFDKVRETWTIQKSLLEKSIWHTETRIPKLCKTHLLDDPTYTDKEPVPGGIWDAEQKNWVVTDESYQTEYELTQSHVVMLIRQQRNTLRDGGLEVAPGVTINTNTTGRAALKEILTYLESTEGKLDFQTREGWIELDLTTARLYDSQISQFVQDCFTACRLHEESINDPSMDTIEKVLAYDYSGGWPANRLS